MPKLSFLKELEIYRLMPMTKVTIPPNNPVGTLASNKY